MIFPAHTHPQGIFPPRLRFHTFFYTPFSRVLLCCILNILSATRDVIKRELCVKVGCSCVICENTTNECRLARQLLQKVSSQHHGMRGKTAGWSSGYLYLQLRSLKKKKCRIIKNKFNGVICAGVTDLVSSFALDVWPFV